MSRRLNRLPHAMLLFPVIFLLSLGLGLPLLHGAQLYHLITRYCLITLVLSFALGVFSLRRRLLPLAFTVFMLSQAALYFFGAGFLRDTVDCIRILSLWLNGAETALYLYGDLLCTQLAVWLTLLCCALSMPDNGLYLPVFGTAALLTMEWMLGLHASTLYMLPVLPGLALHYAVTHQRETADPEHPRFVSPFVLPLATLLTALCLLFSPPEGTTVEPFATLAQQLRDTVDDHFFFTEERSRYTLASDGWMPLGETQLGGPAVPSERDVMLVQTDETAYLRGAILDTYTGGMWYDSVSARRYGWNAAHYRAIRDELFEASYPLAAAQDTKELAVTMLSGSASTVFTPQRIRTLSLGDHMVGYFNTGTEVFITRNLAKDDTYSVQYLPMKATDAGMAAMAESGAQTDDPAYAKIHPVYTKLPSHLQQELFDIAAAAVSGADTPWEKAVAVRDYLKNNYAYTLDVKEPPESVDFLAWFLLAEQKGYCTYFATAMTVLCRMCDLPARYVEGYVAKPDAGGLAHVTGLNAHAWTEVYLNGVGWVTFDATPALNEPDLSGEGLPPAADTPTPAPDEAATPTPQPASAPPATPTPAPESPENATPTPAPNAPDEENPPPENEPQSEPLPWLWLLMIIALLLLLALRIRCTHPLYRAQRAANDTEALLILWSAVLDCAACLHYRRESAETPLQFAARAEQGLGTRLTDIAECVSAIRYGRHNAPADMLARVRNVYLSLEERLSLPHKLTLAVKRAFSRS